MTVALYNHPNFALDHAPEGTAQFEGPDRVKAINGYLRETKLFKRFRCHECTPCPLEILELNHSPEFIRAVREASQKGLTHIPEEHFGDPLQHFAKIAVRFQRAPHGQECAVDLQKEFLNWNRADIPITSTTYDLARLAAGGAVDGALAIWEGREQSAFCIVRPPGHHAVETIPMGYCYFNNIAVAARALLQRGARRVFILDFDVHHGNGTQDSFYYDDRVLVANIHREPNNFYPELTGYENEIGDGAGRGYNMNIALPRGTEERAFLHAIDRTLKRGSEFQPDIILISAGYDAHVLDPKSAMNLTTGSYARIAGRIKSFAESVCGGKMLFVLEGGYHRTAVAQSVGATLCVLDGEDVDTVAGRFDRAALM